MGMVEQIRNPMEKTLGEFINNNYPGFTKRYGEAPLDMDITHGIEVQYNDDRKYGYGEYVDLYPYIKWSDGGYAPCHYWGEDYYIYLERRK